MEPRPAGGIVLEPENVVMTAIGAIAFICILQMISTQLATHTIAVLTVRGRGCGGSNGDGDGDGDGV